jgi:hypothetical protein
MEAEDGIVSGRGTATGLYWTYLKMSTEFLNRVLVESPIPGDTYKRLSSTSNY